LYGFDIPKFRSQKSQSQYPNFGGTKIKSLQNEPLQRHEVSVRKPEVLVRKTKVLVRKPEVLVRKPEVSVQNAEVSGKFFELKTSVKAETQNFELLRTKPFRKQSQFKAVNGFTVSICKILRFHSVNLYCLRLWTLYYIRVRFIFQNLLALWPLRLRF
jgi:hypothetical protein